MVFTSALGFAVITVSNHYRQTSAFQSDMPSFDCDLCLIICTSLRYKDRKESSQTKPLHYDGQGFHISTFCTSESWETVSLDPALLWSSVPDKHVETVVRCIMSM
jgi:epoxyqueuosine reductase QueG